MRFDDTDLGGHSPEDQLQVYRNRLVEQVEGVLEAGLVKPSQSIAALLFALTHNVQMPCVCRTPDGDEYEISDPGVDETGINPVPTFYWSPVK